MRRSLPIFFFIAFISGCGGNDNNPTGGNGDQDMAVSTMDCDVLKQDCGSGQKCVPKVKGADWVVVGATCIADGTVAEGQPCQHDERNTTLINDNCVKGTMCDDVGANATLLCKKFCDKTTACGTDAACATVYTDKWGVCEKGCKPFGTDCPSGNDCSLSFDTLSATADSGVFVCKPTGSVGAYQFCTEDGDCGPNLGCNTDLGKCVPVCDNAHPCPQPGADAGTFSCQPFMNTANGAGVCG
jgi:hypothetical protein